MAKSNKGTVTPEVTIRSARDGGYQAARVIGKLVDVVRGCMAWVKGFGTDKPDPEAVEELRAGILQAWLEAHAPAPVRYRKEGDDTYVVDPNGGVELTAEYAVGLSTHDYGKLPTNWKALVEKVRMDGKEYVSNRYKRMEREAKKILTEGSSDAPRRAQSSFVKFLANEPTTIAKRYASAVKRGEPGLPDAATIAKLIKYMEGIK